MSAHLGRVELVGHALWKQKEPADARCQSRCIKLYERLSKGGRIDYLGLEIGYVWREEKTNDTEYRANDAGGRS